MGIPICSPREPERQSAMVIFEIPDAHLMAQFLKQHHVYTDSRINKLLRIAPFVWNTHEEIDRLFDVMQKGLTNNHYRTALNTEKPGPVT